mgnify:FL=1
MQKFGKKINMSKIGKQPIKLIEGVTAKITGDVVVITGPNGSLERKLPHGFSVEEKDGFLTVKPQNNTYSLSPNFGTTRALLANMTIGVSTGWKKVLELVGAGYRAEIAGNALSLSVGYSHPVKFEAPDGISIKVEKMLLTIEGADKEVVGQVAATIRGVRPPEPYKGKGIKYQDEVIRRKAGKAAKTAGTPA